MFETETKKTINSWGKRLVVAALKGSFNIWLKKCGYNSPVATRPKSPLDWVKGTDDYYDDDRRDDVITQTSQVGLFQEVNMMDPPENIEIEEHLPLYETNSDLKERKEHLLDEEVILLNVDDCPDTDEDYEHAEILKTKLVDRYTCKELMT
jgi:hypothetical protein